MTDNNSPDLGFSPKGLLIGAGRKQSGLAQEECLDELLSYIRIKNINMRC